jgi:uncharacterized membrane protein YhaH (DUF805 family)
VQELHPVQWAVRPLKKYANFSGRAPRAEFWWFYLGTIVVGFGVEFFDKMAGDTGALSAMMNLALLIPWISVTVRRLHDTNRSGWWILAFMFVIAAAIAMTTVGYMRFSGTSTAFAGGILLVLVMLATAVTMLVFMVLPGTEGPNRYGDDPYGPDSLEEVFA